MEHTLRNIMCRFVAIEKWNSLLHSFTMSKQIQSTDTKVTLEQVFFLLICLCFMAYQSLLGIKCQINFYTNKQFYFKQFSLA